MRVPSFLSIQQGAVMVNLSFQGQLAVPRLRTLLGLVHHLTLQLAQFLFQVLDSLLCARAFFFKFGFQLLVLCAAGGQLEQQKRCLLTHLEFILRCGLNWI